MPAKNNGTLNSIFKGILNQTKSALLFSASACGVFHLASRKTADRLRILCYHGTSFENEHQFSAGSFMQPENFRRRMEFLHKWGANVLPLGEALEKLKNNTLPEKAVAITIDDGWYGSYVHMLPILKEYDYPATIYLSTYYIEKQTFVFNLVVPYILFQTHVDTLDLAQVNEQLTGSYRLDDDNQRHRAARQIIDYGEEHFDYVGREALCFKLATICGYDLQSAKDKGMFKFMSALDVKSMHGMGFDVQLHTHTHTFSTDEKDAATTEINKNAEVLAALGISSCRHFCYPSGDYAPVHAAWLEELGIASATTTDFGLAKPDAPVYYLPRICDSDAMGATDFEGAVSGFKDLYFDARS